MQNPVKKKMSEFFVTAHPLIASRNLSLVAEFLDREPVILAGLANMDAEPPSAGRRETGRPGKTHRSKTTEISG